MYIYIYRAPLGIYIWHNLVCFVNGPGDRNDQKEAPAETKYGKRCAKHPGPGAAGAQSHKPTTSQPQEPPGPGNGGRNGRQKNECQKMLVFIKDIMASPDLKCKKKSWFYEVKVMCFSWSRNLKQGKAY
jgi:hypothetical protein